MKITQIKITPINMPISFHYQWSSGVIQGSSKLIIEIETDAGICGLGECPAVAMRGTLQGLSDLLIGKDPLDIVGLELTALPEWKTLSISGAGGDAVKAFGSLDMALWDIKGKCCRMPLYQLLGGAYKKQICFTEYFGFRATLGADGRYLENNSPEAVVEYCQMMQAEHGSTLFEGKLCTGSDYHLEIKTVQMLRQALGEQAVIRLDANYGASPASMIEICRALEPYNIRNIEDPLPQFEDLACLRRHTAIPFSSHICDLRRAVAAGAPDNFCGHPAALGGIMPTIKFIGACEAMGKGFWFYSGDSGITTALYLHLSAALDHIYEPSQSLMRWQDFDVIQEGPFKPQNNCLTVPEGPGLGVTLDRQALKLLHQDYLDNGPCGHYYNIANPGQYVRLPRY